MKTSLIPVVILTGALALPAGAQIMPEPRPAVGAAVGPVVPGVAGAPDPAADAPPALHDAAPPLARPKGHAFLSTKTIAPRAVIPPQMPMAVAMQDMRDGDWSAALRAAEVGGAVSRDIVEWHRLRAGRGQFAEIADFIARNPDWPGMAYMRRRAEAQMTFAHDPAEVLAFFDGAAPQTGSGHIALANALEAAGRQRDADDLRIAAWTTLELSQTEEAYLSDIHGDLLKPHHAARLDFLLWERAHDRARALMPRVDAGWRALAEARIALQNYEAGVNDLIAKVPDHLQPNGGLAYDRFRWRMKKNLSDSALDLMASRKGTVEALGRPEAWASERRAFARSRMRAGDARTAYRLASQHGLSAGSNYSDLEWLSGYIALTYLDEPALALEHFRAFRVAVFTPISLGRAGYWEGRALEALGDAEGAAMAYAFGAEYQTSFYGLLAAERAGLPMDPALTGAGEVPDWRGADFASSTVLEAALILHDAGERDLAERFFTHLAESLDARGVAQLAEVAFEKNDAHIALMIAKRAAYGGIVVPKAYYPVVNFGLNEMPVENALAHAIARRESEFDHTVQSHAGAMGLMQVMPGTARDVARELNISYSKTRLRSDPVYNARLGVSYLEGLIDLFGPNYVLVSAGYNAGPGRPIRWMDSRGDPRRAEIDVVDWIEHIPFRETRNYVMRVMESIPVYRARLTGETAEIRLTEDMKR